MALSYEITQESKPSLDLQRGPLSTKHPARLGNFDGVQATDGAFMHLVADAHLVDSKAKQVGNPNQVYVAFKKDDVRSDE